MVEGEKGRMVCKLFFFLIRDEKRFFGKRFVGLRVVLKIDFISFGVYLLDFLSIEFVIF